MRTGDERTLGAPAIRSRRAGGSGRSAWVEPALLTAGGFALLTAGGSGSLQSAVSPLMSTDDITIMLITMAAACAAMAAVLTVIVERFSSDRRIAWVTSVLVLHGAVATPGATVSGLSGEGEQAMEAALFAADLGGALLVGTAVWTPRRRRLSRPGSIVSIGLFWGAGAAISLQVAPGIAAPLVDHPVVRAAAAGGALVAAGVLVTSGVREPSPPLARAGMGAVGLAGAHLYEIVAGRIGMSLDLAVVRLLALALGLWGLVQFAREILEQVKGADLRHRDELRRARSGLAEAGLVDDEVRRRLDRLVKTSEMLGEASGGESGELRTAVLTELNRLRSMLSEGRSGVRLVHSSYEVAPLVRDLVTLRRTAGTDIRYDIDGSPSAAGSSAVLRQVLVNVLANCARHAPGSPVRIQVRLRRDRVWLRVSDFGPGLPSGLEEAVFDRGVRTSGSEGQGLGLHICRELLAAEGGKITARPTSSERVGCTVVIEVPGMKSTG